MNISKEWLAAESRRMMRSVAVNDFESGELQLEFLMKPTCYRCSDFFEPSQLYIYRDHSVCEECREKMLAADREGYDEDYRDHNAHQRTRGW